ncbi:MAG: cation diffusion facilitator family transporter [Actinomycetota bacterium]
MGHKHPGGGIRGFLHRVLTPHSHEMSGRVDPVVETSAEGIRAVKISLVALLLTAALQGFVVVVSGSVALLGDTLHNVADALTAVPLWIAFSVGRRPPTRRYTYGFGRAEDLAGVFIVLTIAFSAIVVLVESIDRLLHPQEVRDLALVFAASAVGFVGNELVALYRIRVGRKIGSAALVADGLHARVDGLTSLAVMAGAAGVAAGYASADAIVGLLIALAILAILKGAARDVYERLMDAVSPELVDAIEKAVGAVDGVEHVDEVRVRWIGHALRAEINLTLDASLTLREGHALAVRAHHVLLHEVPRLSYATVHVSPSHRTGDDPHAEIAHHFAGRRA